MCIVVVPRCVVGMAGVAGAADAAGATGAAGAASGAIHVSVVCIGAAEQA